MKITVNDENNEWMNYKVVNFDGTDITCVSFDDETKDCVIPLMNAEGSPIQDGNHEIIYVTVNLPMAKLVRIFPIKININAQEIEWDKHTLSYEDIAKITKTTFNTIVVNYHKSNKKSHTMTPGQSIYIEQGIMITAVRTDDA